MEERRELLKESRKVHLFCRINVAEWIFKRKMFIQLKEWALKFKKIHFLKDSPFLTSQIDIQNQRKSV